MASIEDLTRKTYQQRPQLTSIRHLLSNNNISTPFHQPSSKLCTGAKLTMMNSQFSLVRFSSVALTASRKKHQYTTPLQSAAGAPMGKSGWCWGWVPRAVGKFYGGGANSRTTSSKAFCCARNMVAGFGGGRSQEAGRRRSEWGEGEDLQFFVVDERVS